MHRENKNGVVVGWGSLGGRGGVGWGWWAVAG